ncbi:unnamed protein product [Sphagnum balticum]
MGQITTLIRSQIQRRYSNIVAVLTPRPNRVDTLFVAMFKHVQNIGDEISDEVPSNRAKVAADIEKAFSDDATASVAAIFDQIAVEQDHWEDEVFDDEVVELMNSRFERFVLEAKIM